MNAILLLPILATLGTDLPGDSLGRRRVGRALADSTATDSTVSVVVGGFIDAYFAWDTRRPRSLDRAYTTSAARHAEFNVNLAHVDLTLAAPRLRGRVAAQFGTSVLANYAAEPRVGSVSGPDVSRHLQEAFVGYRVSERVWMDAGVYLAPFGGESWISRDNPVYTRSLIADNSPYYQSGVKLTWQASGSVQLQGHVMNGWQNISETNQNKAVAVRADWTPVPSLTLTYDAFVGNEQPDSVRARVRQFHEAMLRWAPSSRTLVLATFDYGRQPRLAEGDGTASWRGFAVLARRELTARVALGGRVEGYYDPEQTIVSTGVEAPLRASGGSANVDVRLHPKATWRTELRALRGRDAVFPDQRRPGARSRENAVLVSSVALTF